MKALFIVGGILCIMDAVGMYYLCSNSGHLSELKDFFWSPSAGHYTADSAAQKIATVIA